MIVCSIILCPTGCATHVCVATAVLIIDLVSMVSAVRSKGAVTEPPTK